ncbi:unnamed protein product [Boreogadus saida]
MSVRAMLRLSVRRETQPSPRSDTRESRIQSVIMRAAAVNKSSQDSTVKQAGISPTSSSDSGPIESPACRGGTHRAGGTGMCFPGRFICSVSPCVAAAAAAAGSSVSLFRGWASSVRDETADTC